LITDNISWRWIFYINVPIGVIGLIVVWFSLKLPGDQIKLTKQHFLLLDFIGILTFTIAILCFLLAVSFGGNTYSWNSIQVILLFIFGGIFTIIFFCWEPFKAARPIISMQIMTIRNIALIYIISFASGWVMLGVINYMPEYFQVVQGDSSTTSGLKLLSVMIGLIIASILCGGLVTKTGIFFPYPIIGGIFFVIGTILVAIYLTINFSIILMSLFLFFSGCGLGAVIPTLTVICQASVTKERMAVALSTLSFVRTLGGVIGLCVLNSILNNQLSHRIAPNLLPTVYGGHSAIESLGADSTSIFQAFCASLRYLFYSQIPISAVCLIAAVFIKHHKLQTQRERSESEVKKDPKVDLP